MQPFTPQPLPLSEIAWEPLIPLIGKANRSIAQYDGVLYGVPNPEVLLSPLTTQEAVLSSRIEGTQATLCSWRSFTHSLKSSIRSQTATEGLAILLINVSEYRFIVGGLQPVSQHFSQITSPRNYREPDISQKTGPTNSGSAQLTARPRGGPCRVALRRPGRREESTLSTSSPTVSPENAARLDGPRHSRCRATTKL